MRRGYARGRPLSDRALLGAAQGGRGPARSLMCFCAPMQLHRVRVELFVKMLRTMIYAFVTCAPCQASPYSCSLNRRTQSRLR